MSTIRQTSQIPPISQPRVLDRKLRSDLSGSLFDSMESSRPNIARASATESAKTGHGMSSMGRVPRVSPVHTAVRNCTRDEGGLRDRLSGADLKPPQAAVVKSNSGERCGNAGA